jgi:hypothetical protein
MSNAQKESLGPVTLPLGKFWQEQSVLSKLHLTSQDIPKAFVQAPA